MVYNLTWILVFCLHRFNRCFNTFYHGGILLKYKKLFASPVKEQKWLNTMAKSGFVFVNKVDNNYYFEPDEVAPSLNYSIEFLELTAETEESKQYFSEREARGEHFICASGLKAYFATKGEFSADSELNAASTRRVYFRDRALVFGSVYALLLGLLTYNLIKWVQFDAMGYVSSESVSFLKKITLDLSGFFGDYPTTPMISFLLPLLVLSFVPTFWFFEEYLSAKKTEKALKLTYIKNKAEHESESKTDSTDSPEQAVQ